jgi:hypothetical protein
VSGDIRAGIDFIALLKFRDTGTHGLDNTGNVPARNEWQRERNVILHVTCSDRLDLLSEFRVSEEGLVRRLLALVDSSSVPSGAG